MGNGQIKFLLFTIDSMKDVNWARAGLGLPLLSDNLERKPIQVPTGPRPTPEGEDIPTDPLSLAHELVAKKVARDRVTDTVVTFDSPTVRRGGLEMSDLAKSPLIAGDPDSEGNKYKRRAPTDWLLRWVTLVTFKFSWFVIWNT